MNDDLDARLVSGLARLNLAMKSEAFAQAGRLGLSPTQGQILTQLDSAKAPQTLSALARTLALSSPTVSDSVAALVEKGLVKKRPAPDDARKISLDVTAAGRRAAKAMGGGSEVLLNAVGRLTRVERATMLDAVIKMIVMLQDQGKIPVSQMCVSCMHFRRDRHLGSEKPHHCALIDVPIAAEDFRIHCPEHAVEPYEPIDCDFHDELEAASTLGKSVELVLRTSEGRDEVVHDVIVDLGHARLGEPEGEYMTLAGGRRVRFDRIVSIDGRLRPPSVKG